MHDIISSLLNIALMTVQLIAIIDPVGVLPLLAPLVNRLDEGAARRVNRMIAVSVPMLLIVFALLGEYILQAFGVKRYDLKIAGGVILLVIAIDILREGFPRTSAISTEEYVFVPIVTPMLVGPGAITSVIVMRSKYPLWEVVVSILIASIVTYLVIRYAQQLLSMLGQNMLKFIGRFMSIVIAALAVSLMSEGVIELWNVMHGAVG